MLNKPSLKSLLCLHSVCCILLTALLLSAVTGFVLRNLAEQRILESSTAYARKLANTADNMFRTAQKELAFSAGQIRSYSDLQALQYETDRLRLQSDMFSSVLALSSDGRVVAASPLNFIPSGTSLNVAPEQLQAIKKGPFVSEPLTPYTGNYLVFLSSPVYSPAGEYLGYLAGSIYLTKSSMLSRLLSQHFYADKTTVSIISDTGEVVYSPDDALTDHLTKLHNRRGFEQLTATLVSQQGPHCLATFDVDYFKNVNDQYGHDTGDQVLVAVSGFLKQGCRTQDIVCRFGGEEFVIFFPKTTLNEAELVANRIRETIAGTQFPTVGHLTVSAGVCSLSPYGGDLEEALASADQLLYRAKQEGRNRVVSSGNTV